MSSTDSYTVIEFARRYKVSKKTLQAFCKRNNLSPDLVLKRNEFKRMLVSIVPEEKSSEPSFKKRNLPFVGKEEPVKEKKKAPFRKLAKAFKLTAAKKAYIASAMAWDEDSLITEAALKAAIDKHLYNRS